MPKTREEHRAYHQAWMKKDYAANPEKYLAKARARYKENPQRYAVSAKAYRANNPEKIKEIDRRWKAANPRKIKAINLRRTGFTIDLYEQTIAEQQGLCAICSVDLSTLPSKQVHADHCHDSGNPRGVLCHGCNTGIGGLRDDPALLRKAIEYLDKHNLLT